jgi:hypothetical protein
MSTERNNALDAFSTEFFAKRHTTRTHEPATECRSRGNPWRKARNTLGRTHARRAVIEAEPGDTQTRYRADVAYAARIEVPDASDEPYLLCQCELRNCGIGQRKGFVPGS